MRCIYALNDPYILKPRVLAACTYTLRLLAEYSKNSATQILMGLGKRKKKAIESNKISMNQIEHLLSKLPSKKCNSVDRFYINTMGDAILELGHHANVEELKNNDIIHLWSRIDVTFEEWVSILSSALIRIYFDTSMCLKHCELLCLVEHKVAADIFPLLLSNIFDSSSVTDEQKGELFGHLHKIIKE